MEELQTATRGPMFGFVINLPRKTDFEAEVTCAGSPFVVVLLYNPRFFEELAFSLFLSGCEGPVLMRFGVDRQVESELMEAALKILATKFMAVKFVKIIANVCIPKYNVC